MDGLGHRGLRQPCNAFSLPVLVGAAALRQELARNGMNLWKGSVWTAALFAEHPTLSDCESGLREAAAHAMPRIAFRPQLPERVLLAGLEKFKNASYINLRGAATDHVRASNAL